MKRVAIAVAALALTGCGPVHTQAKRCTSPANPYGAAPINWRYAKADAEQRARMMDLWHLRPLEKYGEVDVTMALHSNSLDGVLVSIKHLRADDIDSILQGIEQARVNGRVKIIRHYVGDTNTRVILAADGSQTTIAPKGRTIVFAGGVDRDSAAELAEAVFTN